MRPTLLIYLSQNPTEPACWLSCAGDDDIVCDHPGQGPLEELLTLTPGRDIRVLVPSTDVVLTGATVPSRQRQQIALALPYLLEEQLIDEVDTLHFATGTRSDAAYVSTAVISHKKMQDWQKQLKDHGIEPIGLYPDVLALPWTQGPWSIAEREGVLLIRTGQESGFVCAPNHLETLISQLPVDDRPPALSLLTFSDTQQDWLETCETALQDIPHEWQHYEATLLAVMARQLGNKGMINLLQGPYSRSQKLHQIWDIWRSAAWLTGLVIISLFANGMIQSYALQSQNDRLRQQVKQIYRTTFPDEKRIVNPRVQMQRHLDAMRQGPSTSTPTWMLDTLNQAAPILAAMPGLQLQRLTYKNHTLALRLFLPNLGKVERLKNNLAAIKNIDVTIITASAKLGRVSANLNLKQKAP